MSTKTWTKWTPERDRRARELYETGIGLAGVSKEMGASMDSISAAVRRAGGTVDKPGPPKGSRNPAWAGGRQVDKSGYILICVPDHPDADSHGYVREHRLVMERMVGRRLTKQEVVHHVNGVRADNRPENLELFGSNGEHLAHELVGKCPRWTPEGRARILAAATQRRPRESIPPPPEELCDLP